MRTKDDILDGQHWEHEGYTQRMLREDWRALLLNDDDAVIFRGRVRKLIAKRLGAGVYAVTKEAAHD